MKNLILLSICILMFTGCMTQKKQQRIAVNYMMQNPDQLAAICVSKYPAETKFIKGETVTKTDTLIKTDTVAGDCPDGTKIKIPCPPNKTITIDNSRIDTVETLPTSIKAQLIDQVNQIRDLQIKLAIRDEDVKKAELKTKEVEQTANRRLFIIIALGALLGLGVFLRVKKIF